MVRRAITEAFSTSATSLHPQSKICEAIQWRQRVNHRVKPARKVQKLVKKIEMDAPKIGKLVNKDGMSDPKVATIGVIGKIVRKIEMGGPQAGKLMKKDEME